LTEDLNVWREITGKYQADLFCGLFMRRGIEGLSLSAESLVALGSRGILMELDLYRGDDDVLESNSEQIAVADRHQHHCFTPNTLQSRRRLGSAFD